MRRALLRVAFILVAGSASAQGGMTSTDTQTTPGALSLPGSLTSPTTSPGLLLREAFEKHKAANIELIETNAASAAIGLVKEGVAAARMDVLGLFVAGGTRLEVVPFEPDIPLVLTAIYSRQRPVSRVVVRFLAHVRAVLDAQCAELAARGLPGERL